MNSPEGASNEFKNCVATATFVDGNVTFANSTAVYKEFTLSNFKAAPA